MANRRFNIRLVFRYVEKISFKFVYMNLNTVLTNLTHFIDLFLSNSDKNTRKLQCSLILSVDLEEKFDTFLSLVKPMTARLKKHQLAVHKYLTIINFFCS